MGLAEVERLAPNGYMRLQVTLATSPDDPRWAAWQAFLAALATHTDPDGVRTKHGTIPLADIGDHTNSRFRTVYDPDAQVEHVVLELADYSDEEQRWFYRSDEPHLIRDRVRPFAVTYADPVRRANVAAWETVDLDHEPFTEDLDATFP